MNNLNNPQPLDNLPNIDPQQGFATYRAELDKYSGLMRLGYDSPEAYQESMENDGIIKLHTSTGLLVPAIALNGISHTFSTDVIDSNTQIGLIPKELVQGSEKYSDTYFPKQQCFSAETVSAILQGDLTSGELIRQEISAGSNHLIAQSGLPEYMVFSQYVIGERAQHLKHSRPADIITEDGYTVTADRNKMIKMLNSLKQLHVSVFDAQTLQTGYYGGLTPEEVEEFIYDEDFIPIIAYDNVTSEVQLFMLFSPRFKNFASIGWINPSKVASLMEPKEEFGDSNLVISLVTTSKTSGLGLMKYAVRKATEESLYKTQPDRVSMLYECNGLSIGFTPKIIHRVLQSSGIEHHASTVEATTYGR